MAIRLDIAALIALIGEDKLREELDKNTWYLHCIDSGKIHIDSTWRFTTISNPIEYLLFNNMDFFQYVAFRLSEIYDHDKFENEDDYMSWLYEQLDEVMEIPIEAAELLWKTINSYTHNEIRELFHQEASEIYILCDKNFQQVFPNATKEFLQKWFPRE